MKTVNLLFPHQLFPTHEIYGKDSAIYLIEENLFFKQYNFHKQKLAFHRASMKAHEAFLMEKGLTVHYIEAINTLSDIRKLIPHLAEQGVERLQVINPTDNWLEKRIHQQVKTHQIDCIWYDNPLFINTPDTLANFFKPTKKSFFQTSFYKKERVKHRLLLEDDESPVGGKWSFDGDNRKKYPRGKIPPAIQYPTTDAYWEEAVNYVQTHFPNNLGKLTTSPLYPYTQEATGAWLQQFFEQRFHGFGDYEDAIVKEETILHHSVLTPMLNVGLVAPMEVLKEAIAYANAHEVAINSLEGFVRQILGWREFIRGMYECKGTASRTSNFWGFDRKIPASFYNGTTGIVPIDETIKKLLATGYCHHIERLMVLGNFMLLCEFDPNEVYRWFMELFIDAYDWVMVPNVYGMSQFADGGFFATKPYISGSNYLMKMSNYKKGDWQQTWDGLFWRFMHVNRAFFNKNPRLKMLLGTFDRMDEQKRETLLSRAEQFLATLA